MLEFLAYHNHLRSYNRPITTKMPGVALGRRYSCRSVGLPWHRHAAMALTVDFLLDVASHRRISNLMPE
jgi:hypothetical protein